MGPLGAEGVAAAQFPIQEEDQKIGPSDPIFQAGFGKDLDLDGSLLAVAAYHLAGTVYLFEEQGGQWVATGKVDGPVAYNAPRFGDQVQVDGDVMLVSAPHWPDLNLQTPGFGVGRVHVYRKGGTGWVHETVLHSPNATDGHLFGWDIAYDEGVAAIYSPGGSLGPGTKGLIHIFEDQPSGWTLVQSLPVPGIFDVPNTAWCYDLALDGDVLVVGSPRHAGTPGSPGLVAAGAAYVFTRQDGVWKRTAWLSSPWAGNHRRFGYSVDVCGDRIAVGECNPWMTFPPAGAVHVFERSSVDPDTWVPIFSGNGNDQLADSEFGARVALGEGAVAVAAPNQNAPADDEGAVYVFREGPGGWSQQVKLRKASAGANTQLGLDGLAMEGSTVAAGSYGEVWAGVSCGAAFVFEVSLAHALCGGSVNSTGETGSLELLGSRQVGGDGLRARLEDLPPAEPVILVCGEGMASAPSGPLGLCVGASFHRLPGTLADSGPDGAVQLDLDLVTLQALATGGPLVGSTWVFQGWHRDGATPLGSGCTRGAELQFQ